MRLAPTEHPAMNPRLLIATSVVLLHVGVLWALQAGLMRRTVEVLVPAQVLSEFISPQGPVTAQTQVPRATPAPRQEIQPQPRAAPVPSPALAPDPEPSPVAAQPAPAAPAAPAAPIVAASTVAAAPAAASTAPIIELPLSDAAYLNNPKPAYPALSRRLGEQGKVVVRVLIGVDGTVQQAEIARSGSSGYERLDQAALLTVRNWRYVPGKRNGVAEAMWFNVPISFVLE